MVRPFDAEEDLVRRLPLPLAELYREAHNAGTDERRHHLAYYLWEATLRLIGSAALVEYLWCGEEQPDIEESLANLARPSVGHWMEWVRRLVPFLADRGDPGYAALEEHLFQQPHKEAGRAAVLEAAMRAVFKVPKQALTTSASWGMLESELRALDRTPPKTTVRWGQLFDRLVEYRNRVIAHTGQRPPDFYELMSWALLGGLGDLLAKIDPLAGRRLVFVENVRMLPDGKFSVESFELVGETARRRAGRPWPPAQAASLPRPQRLYLETPGSDGTPPRYRPLEPFLLFDAEAHDFLFYNDCRGPERFDYLHFAKVSVERQGTIDEQPPRLARWLGLVEAPPAVADRAPPAPPEKGLRKPPTTPESAPAPVIAAAQPTAAPEVEPSSPAMGREPAAGERPATPPRLRMAVLYKRFAQPDEQVLHWLEQELPAQGVEVFVDRHMAIGVEWARELERRLRSMDAVVLLLSATSVQSEMLAWEVQIAQDEAMKRGGKPLLLPVRINFEASLPSELAGPLDRLQYFLWHGAQDNPRLLAEIMRTVQEPPPLKKIPPPGGVVPLDSQYYVVRPTDEEFRTALARHDSVILLRGARQMGKTSLLARGLQEARQSGARIVMTDFQKLNASDLENIETFYLTLAKWIADELDLDVIPEDVWNRKRGPSVNFERFILREVLRKIETPLVWAMDEVDRLFPCNFGSEVFGLFRSWHNARNLSPHLEWSRLTLAIAYATEAHLFISDLNQSPFNIGTLISLEDFTLDQVAELNRRYQSPLRTEQELKRFFEVAGGQPYLVNRGLYEMVQNKWDVSAFVSQAPREEGIYGDHLRRLLVLIARNEELCGVMKQVLDGKPCPTPESFYRLRAAGIVSGESARDARLRCGLYATYLRRHLM